MKETDLLHFWFMNSTKNIKVYYFIYSCMIFSKCVLQTYPSITSSLLCLFSSAFQSLTDVSADQYRDLWGDEAMYNVPNTFNHLAQTTNQFKYPYIRVNTSLVYVTCRNT